MKIGLQIPYFTWAGGPSELGPKLGEIVRTAEGAGYDSIWVMDHYFQIPMVGAAEQNMLEAYTTLGFIAGQTSRVGLGSMITGVTYRHPGLLIKEATTLDVLSGGRAWLGIGAAWFEREHLGLGVPFPPLRERFERLEEALQIANQMWSDDNNGPYEGKHYKLAETLNVPQALSKPRPRIMIGGGGEKKTLRLVAKYADACNIPGMGADMVRHKLNVLREHCEREGRNYDEIEKTVITMMNVGPDGAMSGQLLEQLGQLAEAGAQTAIGALIGVENIKPIEAMGSQVIPEGSKAVMFSRLDYKWIVGIVFVFGLFMDLLDMTIVNVAIPELARDLNVNPEEGASTIQWVVTGYLLSLAVFIPISGWAGDRFGTKRIFMIALFLFTSASLLCGLAWNIESLIAFRVLQGVGGGILTPVGTAMLFRAFPPEERAKGAAILMIPMVVAPASGPVLGGYLVEYHDWRWIFFINIPIGMLGLVFAALYLREEKQANTGRLDVPGFVLAAAGLAAVMYALAEAGIHGFGDTQVLAIGALGLGILGLFVYQELRARAPMIDMRLFGNRLFTTMNIAQIVGYSGMMGGLFLLPLLLQAEMGLSPFESGLTTFPQAIGVVSMVQFAGRIYNSVGPRRMMMAGMFGSALTTLTFVFVDLETSQWWIRLIMLCRGWSFALILIPIQTATYATIRPQEMGRASAIFNANRQVAASFGVALLATALSSRLGVHDAILGNPATRDGALTAFHEAFIVAVVLSLLGVVAAAFISDREATAMMRRAQAPPVEQEIAPVVAS